VRAQRRRDERRAEVLATARRLFAEKGYHATSIHDIIAAADIARGTFYLYFESKRAIFEELLDGFFATLAQEVKRIDTAPGAPPPLEQMRATVDRIFAVLERERPMARILIREAVGLDEDFDKKLADFYGRVAGLIEQALRTGVAMGLVRPCDPVLVAWCVLGSVKEVCDRVFVAAGPTERDLARLGRELVDFNLRGVFL
jgi:AcrR family transcriptional regulator